MNTSKAIQARVDSFVRDLTAMVRESALEHVQAALGGAAPKKRGPGRPPGTRTATTPTRRSKGKRIRRSSGDVEALGAEIVAYVKANDGCSISDIGTAVGAATKDLRLPVLKLLADRAIKTTGQKRGTKYHAGGGRGPAKKKATRKKATRKKATRKASASKPKRKAVRRKKKAARKS